MFFLLSRFIALLLIIYYLSGCETDESSSVIEIPIVTIDLIEQREDEVSFRLNVTPTPTTDLAVLIEAQALGSYGDNYEIGYTWLMVPRFSNTRDFKFDSGFFRSMGSEDPVLSWEGLGHLSN